MVMPVMEAGTETVIVPAMAMAVPGGGYCQEDPMRINLPINLHVVSLRPDRGRMGRPLKANGDSYGSMH